jgi:hypothetical protein
MHTGDLASQAAHAVGARAFTAGRSIVFGAGEWAPATSSGQSLLAHELAHVAQQRAAPAPARLTVAPAEGDLERDLSRPAPYQLVQRKPGDLPPPPTSLDQYPETERKSLMSRPSLGVPAADIAAIYAPPFPARRRAPSPSSAGTPKLSSHPRSPPPPNPN